MSHLLAGTAIAALQLQLEAAQRLLPSDYPFGDLNALLNTPGFIYGARIRGLEHCFIELCTRRYDAYRSGVARHAV